ncbi:hypothetical protein [uncultured Methanofollis sp.]|uniref:hypothetical protein n=1 Tax=uncultured Methanofollis sp. TaxID=262500 RepID=UPI00262661C9|nr:hypothetical protein [uncultured Methanofollis sp.]
MAVLCLCIALAVLVMPATAATQSVTVTRYCDNNYAVVDDSTTLNTTPTLMGMAQYPISSNISMQGLVTPTDWANSGLNQADFQDGWDATESVNLGNYGAHNGTLVEDIVLQVGGMPDGSEIMIADSTYPKATRYFNKTNVYEPIAGQGEMVLCWWDSEYGFVPGWTKGMRLFFYSENDLTFSNQDMKNCFAPWYWQFSKDKKSDFVGPSAKGLSVQTVDTINIYPPHRYDFATGGDTVEYAYEGGVGASPGLNDPSDTTVDTSKIAADDSVYEQTDSKATGEYAAQRFVFNVTEDAANIEKLAVTWNGTSSHDNSGADQGATTYIWKNGTGYESISGNITSNIGDYVVNGNVTVLVKQNAAHVALPAKASHLATDYVKLVVTHHH